MLDWITGAVGDIASWIGNGIGSFFDWLLGGIATIFTKLINAACGFWDVLDALWNFAIGFKDSIFGLFAAFFPFIPEPVMTAISLGLLAVLLAGIVKKVRGK